MAKQLRFTFGDKEYVLEYTRKSIEIMEKKGFVASDIDTKPVTVLPALFAGAFLANHKYEKPEVIDKIYSKMTNKLFLYNDDLYELESLNDYNLDTINLSRLKNRIFEKIQYRKLLA